MPPKQRSRTSNPPPARGEKRPRLDELQPRALGDELAMQSPPRPAQVRRKQSPSRRGAPDAAAAALSGLQELVPAHMVDRHLQMPDAEYCAGVKAAILFHHESFDA